MWLVTQGELADFGKEVKQASFYSAAQSARGGVLRGGCNPVLPMALSFFINVDWEDAALSVEGTLCFNFIHHLLDFILGDPHLTQLSHQQVQFLFIGCLVVGCICLVPPFLLLQFF